MPNLLTNLLVHDLTGYVPEMVGLDQPISLIGISIETTLKRIYRDVPKLGRRFKELKKEHPIPYRKKPWAFAAVSQGFDPTTGAMTYIMGDVVTSVDDVPESMKAFAIPALKYAIFPVRPKRLAGWGPAIAHARGYAYTVWMPKSGYTPAGPIDDFELQDERSILRRDPQVDLYVAVKAKDSRPDGVPR